MTRRHSYLLPGRAKPARQARRCIMALAIFVLAAGFAVAVVSRVAGIGTRLADGRPAWLILAGGFELMSALGFVAAFQMVFGEWLAKRTILRMGLAVRAATILFRPVGSSQSALEPESCAEEGCRAQRRPRARLPSY